MLARSIAQNRGLARPENPRNLIQWVSFMQHAAGVRLTIDDAFQVSVVWACISAISKALAASPWKVFARLNDGDHDWLPNDSLVYLLNTRPNPDMTAIAMREAVMISALSWGNGYAEIVFDNANRVFELWPLLPDRMYPERDLATGERVYRYVSPDNGPEVILPAWKVYHLQGPSIDGLMGDNMVAKAAKSIALSIAAEKFASTYFGNGTIPSGVLKYPKTLDDPAYERLKKSWGERHGGPDRANTPALLEDGMEWQSISNDAEKSQLVESRKSQIEEICRFYGVPPHKVQHLDRATWNNIEHLGLEFTRDALTPWAIRCQQEADYKLLSLRGRPRFTRIDLEWLSQGDAMSRAQSKQILRRNGVITVNDWLRSEGMNSIGAEGDIRVIDGTVTRLDQVGAKPAPPPEEPEEDAGDIVADAASMLLASVFDRHSRRIANRRADLKRGGKSDEDIEHHLAQFRAQLLPMLEDELTKPAELLARIARREPDEVKRAALAYLNSSFDSTPQAAEAVVRGFLEHKQC